MEDIRQEHKDKLPGNLRIQKKGNSVQYYHVKSEKMIADKMKQLGIPYRYEAPLRLGRNLELHPDFIVLNVRERKEYYYEHFGMMDNPEYIENAMKRIELYEKNGIFPGDKLLFSWETMVMPLNLKVVEGMMKKFLV